MNLTFNLPTFLRFLERDRARIKLKTEREKFVIFGWLNYVQYLWGIPNSMGSSDPTCHPLPLPMVAGEVVVAARWKRRSFIFILNSGGQIRYLISIFDQLFKGFFERDGGELYP